MKTSFLSAAFGALLFQELLDPSLALSIPWKRQTKCATGVHIIVARASTEAPGEGIIGAVSTGVKQKVVGSDSVAVDYPATLTNYQSSEGQGVAAMTKLIQSYAAACPDSKIVLMGYSQGAQVVGDTLCGTSESGFAKTAPLSADLASKVVAVIQMGDPSNVPGGVEDVGTSKKNGLFPRTDTSACGYLANIAQTYCDSGDEFCDSGASLATHLAYVNKYGTAATDFVVSKAA